MPRHGLPGSQPASGNGGPPPLEGSAVVRSPIAPLLAAPQVASVQISQHLAGHELVVLAVEDDWVRVCGVDGYEGWIHRGYLAPAADPDGDARHGAPERRVSLGCLARAADGSVRALPLRAVLDPDEVVIDGQSVERSALAGRFPAEPAAITRSARERFAGTSYLWGGVTPWGADCSGLVQATFALHGVQLPRDAWLQAEIGEDAGDDLLATRAADLCFFSDRSDQRITHVGIALGDRGLVHLALGRGGFAVERLDDPDDAYVSKLRERFVCARRVL